MLRFGVLFWRPLRRGTKWHPKTQHTRKQQIFGDGEFSAVFSLEAQLATTFHIARMLAAIAIAIKYFSVAVCHVIGISASMDSRDTLQDKGVTAAFDVQHV